jgi:hypothetical protein
VLDERGICFINRSNRRQEEQKKNHKTLLLVKKSRTLPALEKKRAQQT